MTAIEQTYDRLCRHLREAAVIGSIDALVGYDEQTVMPPAAAEYRGEQAAWISGIGHEKWTDPRLGEWLAALAGSDYTRDPQSDSAAVIREAVRGYTQRTQLPKSLVEELARVKVQAQQNWVEARRDNDFFRFAPWLEKMFALKREEADALRDVLAAQSPGSKPTRYDALVDQYEPGARVEELANILTALRAKLVPLIAAIGAAARRPAVEILQRQYPRAAQESFGKRIAARFGFDFQRGRLDVTAHPFCSEIGPHDTRITTRFNERAFNEAFFGILHETGHGLYDQGLRTEYYGLGPGQYRSLGIHESQSRLWENLVGRSRAFWEYAFPLAQQEFPAALAEVKLDDFYAAVNDVRPSLIRVEADEATYNLHILIRFELELALFNGNLTVAELPAAWNDRYQNDLGLMPPNDALGVLQDIHWSAGLIGYFATYALGNMYASQFFAAAQRDLGDLSKQFAVGEFGPLLGWLRKHIHQVGRCQTAAEMVKIVTGEPLDSRFHLKHLGEKFGPLFGLPEGMGGTQ